MAKIIGICSTQKGKSKTSHSEYFLNYIGGLAKERGGDYEVVRLMDLNLLECDNCGTCLAVGQCKHNNDPKDQFNDLMEILRQGDGFAVCSPVYGQGAPAIMINFINRCCSLRHQPDANPFMGKPLLNMVIAGGIGNAVTVYELENYQPYLGFISTGSLGLALMNSDSEMTGMTGFVFPADSSGISGMVKSQALKLIRFSDERS